MKTVRNQYGEELNYNELVSLMDEDIREELTYKYAGLVSEQEFFNLYCEAHEEKHSEPFFADTENVVY